MKQQYITRNHSDSLAILFLGWSFSPTPFLEEKTTCDLLVIYNYRDFDIDISSIKEYSNIYIFAWSFGVYGATQFISKYSYHLPIGFKMAINGTMSPIDDNLGIPEIIFSATLNNLSEQSLLKFYRRICNNNESYNSLLLRHPNRDIDDLRDELCSILEASKNEKTQNIIWNKILIGKNDRIFPFKNQLRAWQNNDNIIITDDAHFPEKLIEIINNNIVNKSLLKKRFSKSFNNYNENASIQKQIAEHLINLWRKAGFIPQSSIIEIGCGTGFLTNKYITDLDPKLIVLNDLCPIPINYFNSNRHFIKAIGDAEKIDFSVYGKFDYLVSASTIQWFENLPLFLKKCKLWLNDNGLIVLSTFGKDNMTEINSATTIALNYYNLLQLKMIIEEEFEIIFIDEQKIIINFDSPLDVLRHIKATGVNSVSHQRWSKSKLNDFISNYRNAADGKYSLTYNPIYIIARKK